MHVEKVRCGQCTMLVPKSEMATHKMMKHGSGNSGQESPATPGLQRNLNDESDLKSGTRKLYPCPECKVNFSSLDAMKEHVKTRHKKQVEVIYKCPKNRCNYQTASRLQMQKHQKEQHSSERSNVPVQVGPAKPITFDCVFCDFTAKTMELLREHRSIHLQKPQEPEEEVPLDMDVTSEDVPPPIEMEVTSEDGPPPIEMEATSEDATPPKGKEVTSEDVQPPLEKEVPGEVVPPAKEKEIIGEDKVVTGKDVPPPVEKEVIGKDAPSPIIKDVTSEDVTSPKEMEVTSDNGTPPIENKEVTSKDVQSPTADMTPLSEKEVTNEDVPLPIGAVDSQED